MKLNIEIDNQTYLADLDNQKSIAITLLPNGQQPSHFGAPACTSKTLEGDGFIGDTTRGGSCNVKQLSIIPHCNGTHTESVSHIVDQSFPVFRAIEDSLFPCVLITVEPQIADNVNEQYLPEFSSENNVITQSMLKKLLSDYKNEQIAGLVIRTLPNESNKTTCIYSKTNYPTYLTNDAMNYLVERQVKHLLVDFPSVDKMYDEGMLSNHHIFWQIKQKSHQLDQYSLVHKTITEMVFVKNEIKDGFYLCNLQIPEIETDAVPSRPVLYPLKKSDE
ncbi:cyclase family protein [Aliikangiella sp. IMCC44359]|uniref:cyclase family protein n=1 Tax=Aliikangiella sp. IMCC44359 TaxID=3459125 RepID=UPI00403A9882